MAYSLNELPKIANNIRRSIIESLAAAGSGHPGGALGITDILTYLYFVELNIDPEQPDKADRDRFVLSPGHMVPGLYATLAERGFFPKSELITLRQNGTRLKGHTFRDLEIGVETTGGSLSQGVSVAMGMALAARLLEQQDGSSWRTYCIISDGELNEGQTWEALMFGAKAKLDNICLILDKNGIQLSDNTDQIMPMEPVTDKLRAFNWNVHEIDGHDFNQIAFALAKSKVVKGKPTVIVATTTPGKGVSFMEHQWQWHGKAPNAEQAAQALAELQTQANNL